MLHLELISTTLIVLGIVLNNAQDDRGFLVWMIANLIRGFIHFFAGMIILAIGDFFFFVMAVHGYYLWKKKGKFPNGRRNTPS